MKFRKEGPKPLGFRLAPRAAGHLRTDRVVAVQNINTARHTVVVDVVLANHTQADTVVNSTACHVHTLRQEQVGSGERDGVTVVGQVLSVAGRSSTHEGNGLAVTR